MEKRKSIKVGSRDSELAMTQTGHVISLLQEHYPEYDYEIVKFKTKGDKILNKKLDKIGGKGLFIRELQEAMARGDIDFAVHSLKDMPADLDGETEIVAVPKRENKLDALIMPIGKKIEDLAEDAVIGTSSIRREIQLRKLYPKATIKVLRGNVITRLRKLDDGEYDAIILAAAGLCRLGLEDRVTKLFLVNEMMPAVSQGALGIEAPKNTIYREMFAKINNEETMQAAFAERAFMKALDGSCSVPIAAHTEIKDGELTLYGLYGDAETMHYDIQAIQGDYKDYYEMAAELAKNLIDEIKREKN